MPDRGSFVVDSVVEEEERYLRRLADGPKVELGDHLEHGRADWLMAFTRSARHGILTIVLRTSSRTSRQLQPQIAGLNLCRI